MFHPMTTLQAAHRETVHRSPGSSIVGVFLLTLGLLLGMPWPGAAQDAWDALREQGGADLAGLSPLERNVLRVLTPEQAQRFAEGASADEILLADGHSLGDFMARAEQRADLGQVFHSLTPCRLLDTRVVGQPLRSGAIEDLWVRGATTDYSPQGGAAEGCDIPGLEGQVFKLNTARAVMLLVDVVEPSGSGGLKLWPADRATPPELSLIEWFGGLAPGGQTTVVASLCGEEAENPCQGVDLRVESLGSDTHLVIDVLGYFELAQPSAGVETVETPGDPTSSEPGAAVAKEAVAKMSSPWIATGDDIFYQGGNVGIGTGDPISRLDVEGGAVVIRGGSAPRGGISATERLRLTGQASDYIVALQDGTGRVQHYWNAEPGPEASYLVDGEPAGKILFHPAGSELLTISRAAAGEAGEGIDWQELFRVDSSGKVGIRQPSPEAPLHLRDVSGAPGPGQPSEATVLRLEHQQLAADASEVDGAAWDLAVGLEAFSLRSVESDLPGMTVTEDGRLGLLTATPEFRLDLGPGLGTIGNVFAIQSGPGTAQALRLRGRGSVLFLANPDEHTIDSQFHWFNGAESLANLQMSLTEDGNLGIGTHLPEGRLHIAPEDGQAGLVVTAAGQRNFVVRDDGDVGIGVPFPIDKLAVRETGGGRAGFFEIDNSSSVAASIAAITRGRGAAVFANVLNPSSSSPAIFAATLGTGPVARLEGDVEVDGDVALGGNLISNGDLCIGSGC